MGEMEIKRPQPQQPIPDHANLVFKGATLDIYQWEQELFDGTTTIYESTRRPDSVTVIPVTQDKKILLLEQTQAAFKNWFLSFPGGQIDPDENAVEAVHRELMEETGYQAEELELWDSLQPFTRMDWAVYTFIARGCRYVQEKRPDSGEKIKVKEINFEEFLELVEDDSFRHTDISLQVLKMRLHKDREEELRKALGL